MSPLSQSIYKTLAFFDAEDLPLTLAEVSGYLLAPCPVDAKLFDIEKTIATELAGQAAKEDGFYFLSGRENLVELRKEHYTISLMRFRKARRVLWYLRFIPYLRAVAISGSQALLNSRPSSDIDLFVITSPKRIWLARLFVSLFFQVIGQRRHGRYIRGRFCLNHYLEANQVIREDRNVYTAIEYASLIPVLGTNNWEEFWKQNLWIKEYLVSPVYQRSHPFFHFEFSPIQRAVEFILDFTIAPLLNYLAGLYQKHRIKKGDYILVSQTELSFHPGSRGQRVLEKFQANFRAS